MTADKCCRGQRCNNCPETGEPADGYAVLAEVVKWALAGHLTEAGVTVEAGKAIRAVACGLEPSQCCDDCANRGHWRAVYSKVPVGPQGFAVADCPHAYPGTAVTPGSGTHCAKFKPKRDHATTDARLSAVKVGTAKLNESASGILGGEE